MTILLTVGFVVVAGLLAYGVLSVFAKRDAPLDTEKEEHERRVKASQESTPTQFRTRMGGGGMGERA